MDHNSLSEQEIVRRNSLKALRELGINPYPAESFFSNISTEEILKEFNDEKEDQLQSVKLAGRLMSRRIMGNASFAEIQDDKGRIQLYFKRDEICPGEDKTMYNKLFKKHLDIGDIIGVEGHVFRTKMGEISIFVKAFTVLCKSLRPLPIVKSKADKTFDAFTDPEQRYRNRSMDLIVNKEVRETFRKRSQIISEMRRFLSEKDFLEVETPILQPIHGGAAARPFQTHHNTLDQTLYLRIANELYLKRLIVGGYDAVFEFAKDFRNEGMDRYHNPEFTQMELYVAYRDYQWMMELMEEMIETIVMALHGSTEIRNGEHTIDFKRPWQRYTMFEAIEKFTGIDISAMEEAELRKTAKSLEVEVDDSMAKGKLIDEIFGSYCEPKLIQPCFITDYPIEMSPLAKKHRDNDALVERFEAIVNGKEICNAYTELNDPVDQRKRFEEQLKLADRGDEEAMALDEDFLKAIEVGMPPTTGLGIGIDRLAMVLLDKHSIQEVIFFPQMRLEKKLEIDPPEKFTALGIPEEWVDVMQRIGVERISMLKGQNPNKMHQDLCGYNKKNKLGLKNPAQADVKAWLEAIE